MYRLTNLTLDKTTTYKNKDLIYQALERENAKVKHQEAEGFLLVEELDKKGVVISQEDIYLPFDGIADSLFLKTNTSTISEPQNKEKKRSLLKRSEVKNEQESTSKEKQDLRKSVSDTSSKAELPNRSVSLRKELKKWGVRLVIVISLALASFSTMLIFNQTKQVISLSRQVKQLENLQSESGKLDTFVRYFLPNYFSEQGQLEEFVTSSLTFKHQSGQLQSVILESISQTADKTYQLTYVVSLKDGEKRSQNRLKVDIQEVPSALYGYQVITEPKLSDYPK